MDDIFVEFPVPDCIFCGKPCGELINEQNMDVCCESCYERWYTNITCKVCGEQKINHHKYICADCCEKNNDYYLL